ncbi:MAG: FxsA family protein [Rubellimicrobium sp.]|nr:FxsA family protein [Rubellimicrobium sp.]
MWAFAALVALPLIEIALFIRIGGLIGAGATLALVVGSAALGVLLLRGHGLRGIRLLGQTMRDGRDPGGALFDAAMVMVAGILLILPGFLSDLIALALLLPPVRAALYRAMQARAVMRASVVVEARGGYPRRPTGDRVIEGEFTDVTPGNRPQAGPSGWTRH